MALSKWTFKAPDAAEKQITAPHVWSKAVGTAIYTTSIDLSSGSLPTRLVMNSSKLQTPARSARRGQSFEAHAADPLGVVAAVSINGEAAGVFWDPPYTLDVSSFLRQGNNTIEIAVSTTSIPHMRKAEWKQIWDDAHAHHGRRFVMQEIEYAAEETDSGLLVVPELR